MGRAVRLGLAAIGLLLLVLLIALLTVDLGRLKPFIVDYASDYLERTIHIDGPLSIEIGQTIQVSAEAVRIASTSWTESPDLVAIDRISVTLETFSLLSGVVLVDDLQAGGIEAHLVMDEQGNDNWTFTGLTSEEAEEGAEEAATVPVVIRRAAVSRATLRYSMPDLPPLTAEVTELDLDERADQGLQFRLTGAVNDTALQAAGGLGTPDEIIEGSNVPFELTASLGEIEIIASGLIDDLYDPRRPAVDTSVTGPNAEYLTSILGMDPVTTGPFAFEAQLAPSPDALAVLVDGTYGEFDLNLSGELADLQSLDSVDLDARATGPSIGTVARLAGQTGLPDLPFTVGASANMTGTALQVEQFRFQLGAATVQASASLPSFPGIEGAQAQAIAAGPELADLTRLAGLPDALTGPFEAELTLRRSSADSSSLDARLESRALQADATGEITDHATLVGSTVSVSASGSDAASIATALAVEGVPAKPFAASADLTFSESAIGIANGTASIGDIAVAIRGNVGHEPISDATALELSSEISDLAAALLELGLDVDGLPAETLNLDVALRGGDGVILIQPLTAQLGGIETQVDARISENLSLTGSTARFAVSGARLAELIPLSETPLTDHAFQVSGRLSFASEEEVALDDLQARYGPARAQGGLKLRLTDPMAKGEFRIDADSASLTDLLPDAVAYVGADTGFRIVGSGSWQEDRLSLDTVNVRVGEATVDVQGQVHAPPELSGTALTLNASLPSLKLLEAVAGQPLPDEPLTVRAELRAEREKFELSPFDLTLGQSDLSGTASLLPAGGTREIHSVSAELNATLLDLRPLQAMLADAPGEQEETIAADDGRLIPDVPVPIEALRMADADVLLAVERVLLDNTTLADVELDASLQDGQLQVDRFALAGEAGGALAGSLQLTPTATGANLSLAADGVNMIVGLPAADDAARAVLPRYEVDARLAASGLTVRELAASSQGYLRLVADEGRVALGPITAVMGDFMGEVFDTVNPFAQRETDSHVQCIAVLVEVNDGIIHGEPAVVLQTDKLNITGVGRVNLSTEKLHAKFHTQARQGIGIGLSDLVSPLTEVGGTLASPRLQLNTAGTIVEGGAAVATVGISFLAKKARDRLFSNRHPCRTAIAEADEDLAEGGVPLSDPTP